MPPEGPTHGARRAAQLAHAIASVAPIHDALGTSIDDRRAGALMDFYGTRPAWAIPGSVSPGDAMFLAEMVHANRPRLILEVGVASGCSTAVLAWAGAPIGARVVALDAMDRWYIDPSRPVACAAEAMLADRPDLLRAIEVRTGCTALDASAHAAPGTVDLAFLDADHRHPWPILDAIAILDLVREGAWIVAHDTRLAEIAARHERKSGRPAPWSQRGPEHLVRAWPAQTIHAATDSANIAALRVTGDRAALRGALLAAIDASPWEVDASDPMVQGAVERIRPVAVARPRGDRAKPRADGLRIALVTREFPPAFGGGIGTAMAHTAAALVGGGHTVHVVCAGTGVRESVDRPMDGLEIHRLPVRSESTDWWASRLDFAARAGAVVDRLAQDGAIDVAEFPECEAPGVVHMVAQARPGPIVPTVVQLHTPTEVLFGLGSAAYDGPCPELWSAVAAERACVGLADVVYAPSRFIAEWAHGWWRLEERPGVVAYPHAPETPAQSPLPENGPHVVLHAGRLEPRKGVCVLAEAWNDVAARHRDALLVFAGADTSHGVTGGSVARRMRAMMTAEAAQRTIFAGPVPPAELAALIDRSSVCVVPSLWENFPNVAIEAMVRGRSVVASDHGGMAEMIGATSGGVVFPTGDGAALARALGDLLDEPPASLRRRGAAARSAIERVCDPVATTAQRERIYREAIARAVSRDTDARRVWVDLAEAVVRAGAGEGSKIEPRPVPEFTGAIRRWVCVPRPVGASAA
jgi:glycosyltransferase involved in cell wall biosynthesis/predicted O-methyltransferase YrrM